MRIEDYMRKRHEANAKVRKEFIQKGICMECGMPLPKPNLVTDLSSGEKVESAICPDCRREIRKEIGRKVSGQ